MPYSVKGSIDHQSVGAELKRLGEAFSADTDRVAATQAASVAATVGDLVTDFNALLTKLKAAGLMASS